ncbi:MAG: glycoside hydrolase family 43 protein [Pseudonocardiales bacterium]
MSVPGRVRGYCCAVVLCAAAVLASAGVGASPAQAAAACALHNPVVASGADPSVWFESGYYYLVQSDGNRSINLRRSSTIGGLGYAKPRVIWTSPTGTDHSAETWAPELEKLNGLWYVYFAADNGSNVNHRIFAITANTSDPMGSWSWAGKISDSTNEWAIDPTVFSYSGNWWMVWSGTDPGMGGAAPQSIYLAQMSDPLHIDQDYRRLIARPDQPWETVGAAIEEGPEAWIGPGNTLTIVFNASGSWTDSYMLGELVYNGTGAMTTYLSYTKRPTAFSSANGVYGTAGESIPVPGPNGQTWNIYHADSQSGAGWNGRHIYAQPMHWSPDGTPDFGVPSGARTYDENTGALC